VNYWRVINIDVDDMDRDLAGAIQLREQDN
jgi:hypothetical protein